MEDTLKIMDQWIRDQQNQMLEDLARLIRIKSVSGPASGDKPFGEGPAHVLDEALAIGARMGFETENHNYYAGSIRFGSKTEIGILGHLDVVPEGSSWATDPYQLVIKDGVLYGRGVADDKGPAVMALYAMKYLKDHRIPLRYGIRLVLGCDEESGKGFRDMDHFLKVVPAPLFSLVPDADFPCCNGEKGIVVGTLKSGPMEGQLVSFRGGQVHNMVPDEAEAVLVSLRLDDVKKSVEGTGLIAEQAEQGIRLKAKGTSRHAAYPFGAVSALERLASGLLQSGLVDGETARMMRFVSDFQSDYIGTSAGITADDGISTPLTAVIGVAGTHQGRIALTLNLRYPTTASAEPILEKLSTYAAGYGFSLEDVTDSRPLYYPPDHPAIQTLVSTFNELTGRNDQPKVIGGGTYARAIPRAVSFGTEFPGEPETPEPLPEGHGAVHQPDEAWSLKHMTDSLRIYILTLIRLNGLPLEELMQYN